jgi:hypothetical protein
MQMWGAEESTCLEIRATGEEVEDLRLRVDMREPRSDVVVKTLAAASKLDLVLVTETGAVVDPTLDSFLDAARQSPAAAFVEDPRAFLGALRRKL